MGLLGGLRSKGKHAPKLSVGPGPVRAPAAVSKPRRGALTASPAAGAGPRSPSPRFARSRSSRTSPSSPRNQGAERAVADALGGESIGRQRDPASSRMEIGAGALLAGSLGRNGRVLIKASRTPAARRRARGNLLFRTAAPLRRPERPAAGPALSGAVLVSEVAGLSVVRLKGLRPRSWFHLVSVDPPSPTLGTRRKSLLRGWPFPVPF